MAAQLSMAVIFRQHDREGELGMSCCSPVSLSHGAAGWSCCDKTFSPAFLDPEGGVEHCVMQQGQRCYLMFHMDSRYWP